MLTHIYIRNIAIIREIDIDIMDGLNIISGETGTGKSIVIQAVDLALGGRSSSGIIAENADKAVIQLVFSLSDEEKDFVSRYIELEDDTLILTRELTRSRSLARINRTAVNLSVMTDVASGLIDIHGQYDNRIFMDTGSHMEILDNYAGEAALSLKKNIRDAYHEYSRQLGQLRSIRKNRGEYLRRLDYMKFEYDEIVSAAPRAGEDDELEERLKLLLNNEKISSALNECYGILYSSRIDSCQELLDGISDLNEKYKKAADRAAECIIIEKDLKDELRSLLDGISYSPEELDAVMKRIDTLDRLKKKYGDTIEEVISYRDRCAAELSSSADSDEQEKRLVEDCRKTRELVASLSEKLSAVRKEAAASFREKMLSELKELSFDNADFAVSIEPLLKSGSRIRLTENGSDSVEFLFNSNKGGSLKPLASTASGGEISRISLAFKSIISDHDMIDTMIFDEIDTGISGRAASAVAARMRVLGRSRQIICITHLPQIAAAGDHHFLISKTNDDEGSRTSIRLLDHNERKGEIARLLGGTNITETTLKSAEELIESYKDQPV